MPWVSRAVVEEQRRHLVRAQAQYDDLLARYHMLRLQGYVETPSVVTPAPRPQPDLCKQAIYAACEGRPALRAQMLRQLAVDRSSPDFDEMETLRRIQDGEAMNAGAPD